MGVRVRTFDASSLGWGVQSTTILRLAENGVIPPIDAHFHGGTQCDGEETEEFKLKVMKRTSTPIIEVTRGNLGQDILKALETGERFSAIPTWCKGSDGKPAPINRQCTLDYKITPVRQAIKKHLGYEPQGKVREKVYLSIGFSIDERQRLRDSRVPWITNEFPLIDLWWHKQQCRDYLASDGFPNAPSSSCEFCPFKSNAEWRRLRENKSAWIRVCEFDEKIRNQPKLNQAQFLHRTLKPLHEADIESDDDQLDLRYCGGACGL
jgi:3'-phosphoadenosine 5'-phosphosulfate sulfotransferase (PAPS reductase)/FAD synthetase